MRIVPTLLLLLGALVAQAQDRLEDSFVVEENSEKVYALYVPSGYDSQQPTALMIGFHPLNTNRWDAISWRDTLVAFAEANNLLLVCPNGGADGRVNDRIDTVFTSQLIDSCKKWYNIDEGRIYAMGFSWGGLTTYTYGLSNPAIFGGYIPIGAAVNGTQEVNSELQRNAKGKPVYIVHGDRDAPAIRYVPVKEALEKQEAIVNSLLMPGVNHTIDFPDRNEILTTAFRWVDSVNTAAITSVDESDQMIPFEISPNPVKAGKHVQLQLPFRLDGAVLLEIVDLRGNIIRSSLPQHNEQDVLRVSTRGIAAGTYFIRIKSDGRTLGTQLVIQ